MKSIQIELCLLCLLGYLHAATSYSVGVGRGDCTGPPVEIVFVVRKLQIKYGAQYRLENVAISGSHTHATPGGFNEYAMYDMPTFGYVRETQRALIFGIFNSIVMAHDNIQNARIFVDETEILDANINRSPMSYLNNPADERAQYKYDTDKTLTQLRFVSMKNEPIGVLNWYAVHATSLHNSNKLVSTDNVGYASILLEQQMDPGSLVGHGKVIAAFASSNLGDSSPNTNGAHCQRSEMPCDILTSKCPKDEGVCVAEGPGKDQFDSCQIIARKLFNGAWKLLKKNSGKELSGYVNFAHQFIDMPNTTITYFNRTTNQEETVSGCIPAMGYSFAAGTTDGPGLVEFFNQGTTTENPFWNMVFTFLSAPSADDVRCQAPKPILLATGRAKFPHPWQPKIVPTQLLQIGNFIIAAVPGEFTTMSGRRLRNAIASASKANGNPNVKIVVAGLTNSYSSYIATPEEYQIQRYEGASTIFGPYTLPIYLVQFTKLFQAMAQNVTLDSGPLPPNFDNRVISFTTPVLFDGTPFGKTFGEVTIQPKAEYNIGDQVVVQFISSNPRNNLFHGQTYFTVDKYLPSGEWTVIATDANWDTKFVWTRTSLMLGQSVMNIFWDISNSTESGHYRIRNFGSARSILGTNKEYVGITETFTVL